MKRALDVAVALGMAAVIYWAILPASGSYAANVRVPVRLASPQATVTPRPDLPPNQIGLPQPVTAPTCVYGKATLHGDSAGCVYSCNSNIRRIISGNGCVISTPATASTPVAP